MTPPQVSVLMPVYNAERYVDEAVKSILRQTFTDFEFIIINDGSTDQSLRILSAYADRDDRIRLINRENKGLVATLNEMIALAKGEYLARMDADDIAVPDRFAKQATFLNENQGVVCVGGAFELIDHKSRLLTRLYPPEHDNDLQRLMLAGHTAICHPCAMIRTFALRQVGGYDSAVPCAEDLDVWLRLGEMGLLANLRDCVLQYRLHSFSISEEKGLKQQHDMHLACQRAWLRRGISGHFEATDHWRPSNSPLSQHTFMLKYGWWAFNSRQRKTAVIYGLKTIKIFPWVSSGWKLLLVSLFKPFPPRISIKGRQ
nr:glycosyltransferase family A protein [uncultured Desulfobulbus sp.]